MPVRGARKEIDELIKKIVSGEVTDYEEELHTILFGVYGAGIKVCSGIMKRVKEMNEAACKDCKGER